MICLRTFLRIYEKKSNTEKLKNKKFFGYPKLPVDKIKVFLGHNNISKDWNLIKNSAP
jgi:glutaredoxin-related protein